AAFGGLVAVVLFFGDGFEVRGHTLPLQMPYDLPDFVIGDEGSVHAHDAAAARHVEHVALSEQLLCALLTENGGTVDLGGNLEADPSREVRLDGAGDHVDARTLGGGDQMNAGGARHLR